MRLHGGVGRGGGHLQAKEQLPHRINSEKPERVSQLVLDGVSAQTTISRATLDPEHEYLEQAAQVMPVTVPGQL